MDPVYDNSDDDFEIKIMPDGNLWLVWERRDVPTRLKIGATEHVLEKFAAKMSELGYGSRNTD
jgi:hypothetical protein